MLEKSTNSLAGSAPTAPWDSLAMTAYRFLEQRFAHLAAIADAIGILEWDAQTTMPPGAAGGRASQLAALRLLQHQSLTDPAVSDALERALDESEAQPGDALADPESDDAWRRANLREMRRALIQARAVPAALVEASSRAVSACEMAWRQARADNDFAGLRPLLEEVLKRQRELGAARGAVLGLSPYDALLDGFEPEARADDIATLFDALAAELPELIGRVLEHQARLPEPLALEGPFPEEQQRALGLRLMTALGFDFERGRLDVSLHPFCGGATDDVRLTTRYQPDNFIRALLGILHETGHALYEQGRPRRWRDQPVGQARGMALHESQSLVIEMQACRTPEFVAFLAPLARASFGGSGDAWSAPNLLRQFTRVERSLIRVDADEVTYPAHVILRFRLERAMIEGDLALADLPGAWADGLEALLGLRPPDDASGCLQDIHWPSGGWGYFPTYTLGALIAAQLFDAARRDDPALLPGLGQGDFAPLRRWLRRQVHGQGSRLTTAELVRQATGRPLEAGVFLRHLEQRYLAP